MNLNWYVQQTLIGIALCACSYGIACLLVDGVGGWLRKRRNENNQNQV